MVQILGEYKVMAKELINDFKEKMSLSQRRIMVCINKFVLEEVERSSWYQDIENNIN